MFATVGDKKEGGTHILYDPSVSQRGALVCVARAPRKQSFDDFVAQPIVHNPHALPLFRDQPSRKRQREKILKDPLKSHKPDLPVNGPGFGGRVGSTKGSLLTQYLMKVCSFSLNNLMIMFTGMNNVLRYYVAARWFDKGDMDGRRSEGGHT